MYPYFFILWLIHVISIGPITRFHPYLSYLARSILDILWVKRPSFTLTLIGNVIISRHPIMHNLNNLRDTDHKPITYSHKHMYERITCLLKISTGKWAKFQSVLRRKGLSDFPTYKMHQAPHCITSCDVINVELCKCTNTPGETRMCDILDCFGRSWGSNGVLCKRYSLGPMPSWPGVPVCIWTNIPITLCSPCPVAPMHMH